MVSPLGIDYPFSALNRSSAQKVTTTLSGSVLLADTASGISKISLI